MLKVNLVLAGSSALTLLALLTGTVSVVCDHRLTSSQL